MRNNRQHRCNQDLRDKLYKEDIYIYEIGKVMGVSRTTIYKWFDSPLSSRHRKLIDRAIKEIREERRYYNEG